MKTWMRKGAPDWRSGWTPLMHRRFKGNSAPVARYSIWESQHLTIINLAVLA
ncbi:hypothetical protein JZ785_23370 [Alicyclobacillus curvatus]|nr:hypothetical protein JZ785_23370 [Alicyclobacillus curvatus]